MDKNNNKRYTDFKSLAESKPKIVNKPQMFKAWKCGGCGKLLGLIYSDGELAVKYKDLTAWVMGTYRTVCRFCKITNVYRSGHGVESLEDLTKNEEVK